jgi:hypothetical protein
MQFELQSSAVFGAEGNSIANNTAMITMFLLLSDRAFAHPPGRQ